MSNEEQTPMPSIREQLVNLDVGQTFSVAKQIDPSELHTLNEVKKNLRQHYSPPIKRASDSSGQGYIIETTELITATGNIFVVTLITRTS
jgi:hypothetical protein